MTPKKSFVAGLTGILLLALGSVASTQEAEHSHEHDGTDQPTSPAAKPTPNDPARGSGMMMPMGQMGMGQMGQMGMPMGMMNTQQRRGMPDGAEAGVHFPGMGMVERVEGRIAFLKTELKIEDAQKPVWEEFAEVLRDNTKTLSQIHGSGMRGRQAPATPTTIPQRLEAQEQWYAARLKGIGAMRQAIDRLYAVLSAEQKETAEELLGSHLGLIRTGRDMMGMMPRNGLSGTW